MDPPGTMTDVLGVPNDLVDRSDDPDHIDARARIAIALEALGSTLDAARESMREIAAHGLPQTPASYAAAAEASLAAQLLGARAAHDCARRSAPTNPAAAEFWRGAVVAGDAAAAAAVVAGSAGDAVRGPVVVRALGRVVARWEWRRARLAAVAAGDAAAAADLARRARRRFRRAVASVLAAAAESAGWLETLRRVEPALRAAITDLDAIGWPVD